MNFINTSKDTPGKILIIRLSSIGDILLSTPFIRQVKKTYPKAKIDFIVKNIYKDLLDFNPHLNKLYSLKLNKGRKELKELKVLLRECSYNVILDLHNNLRSNYLKRGIHAEKIYSIKKEKIKQTLLVQFKINLYKTETPIPDKYLAVAKDYDILDDGKGLDLYWNKNTTDTARTKMMSLGLDLNNRFICLAPGAGFYTKRWPEEKFEKLIALINRDHNFKIVVLGNDKEREIGSLLKKQRNIIDSRGKLSLLETAYIISKGMMIVTNDSGLMHMATAVKTPVLAIFGSTVKELGFFPYRAESRVVENSGLSCRPCSHIGRNTCPKNHFKCMMEITPEDVYTEMENFSCL